MKKLFVSFVISLLFQLNINAQSGWFWQNPRPQGNDLYDICRNDLNGYYYACGAYGTVLSQSIGNIWIPYNANTKENLYSICFKNTLGWAVGSNGTIMHSADGVGVVWFPQQSGTTKLLNSVFFLDGQNGWAVGAERTILHTSNGGQNWEVQTTGGNNHLHSVFFLDESIGYTCGYDGVVLKTTNGGTFWLGQSTPTFNRLRSIYFKDINNGVTAGENGTVLYTTNAGLNWYLADSKTTSDLMDAYYDDQGNGYAVGYEGVITYTSDLGQNWNLQNSGTESVLFGVSGDRVVGQSGIILKSSNIGQTWEFESNGFYDYLNSIDFTDENNGWIVGTNGAIYQTVDGGNNWIKYDSLTNWIKPNPLSYYHFAAVDFITPYFGYVVGTYGTVLSYKTSGDVSVWVDKSILTNHSLFAVDRHFGGKAWVAGEWGDIWKTEDLGETWQNQHQSLTYHLYAIHFINSNYGWAAGSSGAILKTTDGGNNWIDVSPDNLSKFHSIYFTDRNKGWVVGAGGIIYRTVDGGETWIQTSSLLTSKTLNSVYFVDEYTGWIAGFDGTVLYTSDGGVNWYFQDSQTNKMLRSITFIENGIGWIAGKDGTLIKTLDGGGELMFDLYHRYNLNIPILDLIETNDVITINFSSKLSQILENNILSGIIVMIDTINHTHVSDLNITISHNGITDTLFYQAGGDSANIIKCRLSDGASISTDEGEAPFTGYFKPHTPLSVFNGVNPIGDWTLSIYDAVAGNTGTLQAWGLKLFFDAPTNVKSNDSVVPNNFEVYQNFPNPFNPSTTIRWQMPKAGLVTLKIYDVLGREVATLVNEELSAGKHETLFDASRYSSGVYFYQLKVGSFVESKKMILMK